MQSQSTEHHSPEFSDQILGAVSGFIDGPGSENPALPTLPLATTESVLFEGHYVGQMEMMADAATVAQYLDAHPDWFRRCAQPMVAEPVGETGYAITIGQFGALDFEIEPKVGLDLLPQDQGVYRIRTIPVPGYDPDCYSVDFRASMHLLEIAGPEQEKGPMTQVEWELNLSVWINFPRFIQVLPRSLVKTSGDRLLNEIVRQVSKRLTRKVQEDFHQSMGLALPETQKRHFWQR